MLRQCSQWLNRCCSLLPSPTSNALQLAMPSISCGSASIFAAMTHSDCGCHSMRLGRLFQLPCPVRDFGSSHSVITTMWFWDDSD